MPSKKNIVLTLNTWVKLIRKREAIPSVKPEQTSDGQNYCINVRIWKKMTFFGDPI